MAVLARYDGAYQPFSTALDSGFIRNLARRDLDILVEIWREVADPHFTLNDSCGACTLDFICRIGTYYREAARKAFEAANKPASERKTPKAANSTSKRTATRTAKGGSK